MKGTKEFLDDLETSLLAFSVLATSIVAVGFIFKFSCAIGEWWLAVFLSCGIVWWKNKDWKRTAVVSAIFFAFIGTLWLVTNVTYTIANWDGVVYHQPAIRLLAQGWNPVWQNTIARLPGEFGLPPDSFGIDHAISMPKGVWYFCAIAYKFTNSHFNLYGFLNILLGTSLVLTLLGTFKDLGIRIAIFICLAAFFIICPDDVRTGTFVVDWIVALSAIGLLSTMLYCLRTGEWSWLRLIAYTFWMSASKQTSSLHCGIFWGVFIFVLILRKSRINILKMIVAGGVAFVLFCIVNCSPYITSWVVYGHPFYPKYTVNAEKFPVRNITDDFCMRNDDALAMGHVGSYLNAFTSSSLVHLYYKQKLKKPNFRPECQVWAQYSHSHGSPTAVWFRLLFCGSLFGLALCGTAGCFLAACLILCTFALPTEMIGYIRYTPWCLFGCLYCTCVFLTKYAGSVLLFLPFLLAKVVFDFAVNVDSAFAMRELLRESVLSMIVTPAWADGAEPGIRLHFQHMFSGNVRLLQRVVPELANARLVVSHDRTDSVSENNLVPCCDGSFQVPIEHDMSRFSRFHRVSMIQQKVKRCLAYLMFVGQTLTVTLPKSIWRFVYE